MSDAVAAVPESPAPAAEPVPEPAPVDASPAVAADGSDAPAREAVEGEDGYKVCMTVALLVRSRLPTRVA